MQGWERLPLTGEAVVDIQQTGGSAIKDACKVFGMVALGISIGVFFVFVRWYFGFEKMMH